MSTMLEVPAALVADFRCGLLDEWGFAAEDLASRALTAGSHDSEKRYEEPLKAFDAARALLDAVGWKARPGQGAIEIDLEVHPPVILKALQAQRNALADRLGEMSGTKIPAEVQHAMIVRAEALGDFVATVEELVQQLGYELPEDDTGQAREREHTFRGAHTRARNPSCHEG